MELPVELKKKCNNGSEALVGKAKQVGGSEQSLDNYNEQMQQLIQPKMMLQYDHSQLQGRGGNILLRMMIVTCSTRLRRRERLE